MNKQHRLLACLALCAATSAAWAQEECQSQLDTAEDKTVDPSRRQRAAQQARLCFEMQLAAPRLMSDEGQPSESAPATQVLAGIKQSEDADADANSADSFEKKYGLGVGIGFSWGRGNDRVDDAEVVNGVVRVKRESSDKPRLFLEAHKFVWVNATRGMGVGPFISVQSGADDALASFGAGVMMGFREEAQKGDAPASWNLGLGYLWDADVKTLGDGITAGAPLPSGETQIRYKNSSAGSIFLMFSRKF